MAIAWLIFGGFAVLWIVVAVICSAANDGSGNEAGLGLGILLLGSGVLLVIHLVVLVAITLWSHLHLYWS